MGWLVGSCYGGSFRLQTRYREHELMSPSAIIAI